MQRITLIKIEELDDAEIKNNIPVSAEYKSEGSYNVQSKCVDMEKTK